MPAYLGSFTHTDAVRTLLAEQRAEVTRLPVPFAWLA